MQDDIVTRLRDLREVLMGNPIMAREVQEAMDEIERLREQIKALVHEWELSERGVHCEHKEVCDEI
jgi:hypothetical protein